MNSLCSPGRGQVPQNGLVSFSGYLSVLSVITMLILSLEFLVQVDRIKLKPV